MVHVCIFDILVKHRYIFFTMFRMFPLLLAVYYLFLNLHWLDLY
jgi:hypothetical protein